MVLVLLAFAPYSASAIEVTGEDAMPVKENGGSTTALYSITGSQATTKLSQALADFKVEVKDDTLIEVIPSGMEEGTHAVLVTNTEDATVTTSKFVAFDKDGSVRSISEPNKNAYSTTDVAGETVDLLLNGSLTVMWAVQYNFYLNGSGNYFFQPVYAQIFYKNPGNHNVASLEMICDCSGAEYTYPGFASLGGSDYSHIMTIRQTSPQENKYYVNTNAYRTDRVIGIVGNGGYIIEFNYKVNNRNYYDIADILVYTN